MKNMFDKLALPLLTQQLENLNGLCAAMKAEGVEIPELLQETRDMAAARLRRVKNGDKLDIMTELSESFEMIDRLSRIEELIENMAKEDLEKKSKQKETDTIEKEIEKTVEEGRVQNDVAEVLSQVINGMMDRKDQDEAPRDVIDKNKDILKDVRDAVAAQVKKDFGDNKALRGMRAAIESYVKKEFGDEAVAEADPAYVEKLRATDEKNKEEKKSRHKAEKVKIEVAYDSRDGKLHVATEGLSPEASGLIEEAASTLFGLGMETDELCNLEVVPLDFTECLEMPGEHVCGSHCIVPIPFDLVSSLMGAAAISPAMSKVCQEKIEKFASSLYREKLQDQACLPNPWLRLKLTPLDKEFPGKEVYNRILEKRCEL